MSRTLWTSLFWAGTAALGVVIAYGVLAYRGFQREVDRSMWKGMARAATGIGDAADAFRVLEDGGDRALVHNAIVTAADFTGEAAERAIPLLVRWASSTSASVDLRTVAAIALGRLRAKSAVECLLSLLDAGPSKGEQAALERARFDQDRQRAYAARMGAFARLPDLPDLDSKYEKLRQAAAWAISNISGTLDPQDPARV